MKQSDIHIGDTITVKVREEAYYSGYAGRPVCWLEPGETAIVAAVDVPSVWRERVSFLCADFVRDGRTWRIGVLYGNVRKVKDAK
jgi:hypothetical protein